MHLQREQRQALSNEVHRAKVLIIGYLGQDVVEDTQFVQSSQRAAQSIAQSRCCSLRSRCRHVVNDGRNGQVLKLVQAAKCTNTRWGQAPAAAEAAGVVPVVARAQCSLSLNK